MGLRDGTIVRVVCDNETHHKWWATRQLQNTYEYLPWGTVLSSVVSDPEKFNYTGQVRDEELGMNLLYYGARYYDPKLRTFLSVDPLSRTMPSWSPCVYCLDNPLKYVDLNGKVPFRAQFGNSTQAGARVFAYFSSGGDIFSDDAQMRYVGLGGGTYVDLRHFSAAFVQTWLLSSITSNPFLSVAETMSAGFLVELQQKLKGIVGGDKSRSAFSPEDQFSNWLGAQFALKYDPTRPLEDQVRELLDEKGAITKDQFIEDNSELWDALPQDAMEVENNPKKPDMARKAMDAAWKKVVNKRIDE